MDFKWRGGFWSFVQNSYVRVSLLFMELFRLCSSGCCVGAAYTQGLNTTVGSPFSRPCGRIFEQSGPVRKYQKAILYMWIDR